MISQQDEHVRHILDRKAKLEDLKQLTIDKIKKYSHSRGLNMTLKPKQPAAPAKPTTSTTKYERTVHRTTYKNY
jgi:hypothetical protein